MWLDHEKRTSLKVEERPAECRDHTRPTMWLKAGEEMDVGDGILFVVSTFSGYKLSMGKNLKLPCRSFTMFGAISVGTHELVLSTLDQVFNSR